MSKFVKGDKVKVKFHPREWNDRWYKETFPLEREFTVGHVYPSFGNDWVYLNEAGYSVEECLLEKANQKKSTWNPLTVEELQQVCDTIPGGIESFCKGWGWLQFAQEVEKICREKNS